MSRPDRPRVHGASWVAVVEERLNPLPAETRHGLAFQSAAFVAPDDEAARCWRAARYELGKGWAVLQVLERPGTDGLPQREQQRIAHRLPLAEATAHVAGWEALQRAEGLTTVPGGDAAALGFRHIDLFLAREGLVLDGAGTPHRYDAASDLLADEASVPAAAIARARLYALPAPAAVTPALAVENPYIAALHNTEAYADPWLGTLAVETRSRNFLEALAGGKMGTAAQNYRFGIDLGHRALYENGAHVPESTLDLLGWQQRKDELDAALQAGLPPGGVLAEKILRAALRHGNDLAVDLLAPHMSPQQLDDRKLFAAALEHPACLQAMIRAGMPIATMRSSRGSALEDICTRNDDRALQVALAMGVPLPAGPRNLLRHAIQAGAGACTRRLLVAGYADRLTAPERAEALQAAVRRDDDATAQLFLQLHPDLAPALAQPDLLDRIVARPMSLVQERLSRHPELAKPLAEALLRAGTGGAIACGFAAGLPLGRAMADAPQPVLDSLMTEARLPAAIAYLDGYGRDHNRLFSAMRDAGGGCALELAVSLRSPELLAVLRRLEPSVLLPRPGAATVLHRAAGQGPAALLPPLLDGPLLQPGFLDAQDGDGATALVRATRAGNIDAARLLMDAGADWRIADAAGRIAADYARLLEDAALEAAVTARPVAVTPVRRRFGFRLG